MKKYVTSAKCNYICSGATVDVCLCLEYITTLERVGLRLLQLFIRRSFSMASIDDDALIEDFGGSLRNESDTWQSNNGQHAEALDASLQAPNANDFSNARLIEEVRLSFVN